MPVKEDRLPIGFVLLALLLIAILTLAILRLATRIQKPVPQETQDLYPWATESMKAAYPPPTRTSTEDEFGHIDQARFESVLNNESEIRQSSQSSFEQMSQYTQQQIKDYETDIDLSRKTKEIL